MTDITELTQESARESGNILIIVAARMARREFFTPLHALCESGKRVVSTRELCDAVERAEEHMASQLQYGFSLGQTDNQKVYSPKAETDL